jgi:hypothetical protein
MVKKPIKKQHLDGIYGRHTPSLLGSRGKERVFSPYLVKLQFLFLSESHFKESE